MPNFEEILSVSIILFSVIDVLGSIPIIINIRKKEGKIQAEKTTIISAIIMISFLFLGQSILRLFNLDIFSFAIAGSIVIFILGLEMILGTTIMKHDPEEKGSGSVIPLAFPVIAGAGTLTTILSLRVVYGELSVLIGIIINLIFVYIMLRISSWIEKVIGKAGISVLRRGFGVILIAIAVKIFKDSLLNSSRII